jgi:hypothetical protein
MGDPRVHSRVREQTGSIGYNLSANVVEYVLRRDKETHLLVKYTTTADLHCQLQQIRTIENIERLKTKPRQMHRGRMLTC